MTITALPTPPSRADSPSDFASKADALLGALPTLVTEMNAATADVTTKQGTASTAATTATTKAGEALTSAGAAAASATAAGTSETNAAADRALAQTAAASITAQVAVATHAATSKTTPVDADELPIADSAASFVLKKLTLTNLKAFLASVFAALNIAQTFTAAQRGAILPVTYAATVTLDLDTSNNFSTTLTGALTLANPTHITPGQSGSIFLAQDATGSRSIAYGAYWKFEGGIVPTASTAASAEDRLDYIVKTSTYIEARLAKAHA